MTDAGAFLARLTRLDPAALVRLRPAETGRVSLWAVLPWGVLVTRSVAGVAPDRPPGDITVGAAELLAELARDGGDLPARRDELWRSSLPPARVEVLERIPAWAFREIGAAAEGTLRAVARGGVGGRPVGDRAVRDVLLDHVAILVTPEPAGSGGSVEVPQRLVQAVIRMGFLGRGRDTGAVRVLRAGRWIGLAAAYGTAWLRPADALSTRVVS